MTPRGIRNNNPGNIIQSGIAWQGKETPSRDPRFESFDTPLNGIRALCKLLISYQDKHNLNTVRGIINRWAPPVENNTSAYVYTVAAALGVPQDRPINTHDAATLTKLATAIIQHENGQQPYPATLIAQAVRLAGGMPVTGQVKADIPQKPLITAAPSVAPSPIPRKSMDPISLVTTLASVFSPLLRAKVEQAVGTEIGKPLVDNLLALAKAETGQSNGMAAVGIAQENPEIVAKLEKAATDWFAGMKPVLDALDGYQRAAWAAEESSKDSAAARGAAMQAGGLATNPQFIIAAVIMVMVAGVVFTVLYKDTFSTDMQSFVIGAIVGGALTSVIGFFFGSSRSSAAKDVVISEMAVRR